MSLVYTHESRHAHGSALAQRTVPSTDFRLIRSENRSAENKANWEGLGTARIAFMPFP
jgi:hypothetical protein